MDDLLKAVVGVGVHLEATAQRLAGDVRGLQFFCDVNLLPVPE